MEIYRANEAEPKKRVGYTATYVADITLKQEIDNIAFIVVHLDAGARTEPHVHRSLQEAFVFLDATEMGVDENKFSVGAGDVVLVDPGEAHWFSAPADRGISFLAIKLPNIPDDKVKASTG
ncbi:MAG: cupin domain-containing protein [Candidatus Thorarchaeota archaeon]|nr:cupin domain-containing protein [Candidatus Thorarchaeota archaeon]